ncbi:MAG: tRNA uridine-5-carboxymethylaminomethyl(34) synthesis GTPase MnmE [Leptospirales bacterium]|nr:tRNA uridine-5-carboxymethylaminomethyl(34) synthesis GTPase MnmE [Leptospirales bacterium]
MTISAIADKATIVAIASAQSQGAVGIIRLSGPDSLAALRRHCLSAGRQTTPDFAARPRHSFYCEFSDGGSRLIDDGLAAYYPAPASYTGEDCAELSLHGNPLLLAQMTGAILDAAGGAIRPARPGEFTRRAYLNGKMDLSRAEAVHRIVTARSEWELQASRKNFQGELSRISSRVRSALIHLKAETEAEIDFAEEDLSFESLAQRMERARLLIKEIELLLQRARETERLRAGVQAALAGAPNAGKSSLMNRILGWDRSIVSPIAGTTRDYVSEEIDFKGVRLRLVDTAGLRETGDHIESQGVRLARETMARSQLVLHIIDGSEPLESIEDFGIDGAVLRILNKSDLSGVKQRAADASKQWPGERWLSLSCVTGEGLEDLRAALEGEIFQLHSSEALLLEERHRFHLQRVIESLQRCLQHWSVGAPQEIVALDLDQALEDAGAITGRIDNEEILGRIFSIFCVGK